MKKRLTEEVEEFIELFDYKDLPEYLQLVANPFCVVANKMRDSISNPLDVDDELLRAFQHLLIAKDLAVRVAKKQDSRYIYPEDGGVIDLKECKAVFAINETITFIIDYKDGKKRSLHINEKSVFNAIEERLKALECPTLEGTLYIVEETL